MSIGFNANEVFEIAIQMERNGGKFYRAAAEKITDPKFREILLSLARMEDDHEQIFTKMQEKLSSKEYVQNAFDPDGDAAMYLHAMAEGKVFDLRKNPLDLLKGDETISDIIKIAIGLEKDSVSYYTGIKEAVSDSLGKEYIEKIIKEEMRHVSILTRELNALS